jgi:hypothetical protein
MKAAAVVLVLVALVGCSAPMVGLKPCPPGEPSTSRPELRWEPLPPAAFAARFAVSDVCYDLRVFDGRATAYSRDGLTEPRHRVEMILTPGKTYTWTVRARFRVDGARRRTEWTQRESSERRDGTVVRASAELVPLKIEPLPKP